MCSKKVNRSDPMLPPYSNFCQCPSCGLYFKSDAAFDRHRAGSFSKRTRRCLLPDEMRGIGMAVDKKGYWITKPMRQTARSRVSGPATSDDLWSDDVRHGWTS
jgi:hypothetical protein